MSDKTESPLFIPTTPDTSPPPLPNGPTTPDDPPPPLPNGPTTPDDPPPPLPNGPTTPEDSPPFVPSSPPTDGNGSPLFSPSSPIQTNKENAVEWNIEEENIIEPSGVPDVKEGTEEEPAEEDKTAESESDDDSDNEEYDKYLQKIDQQLKQTTIESYHPELQTLGEPEVNILAEVLRDENGVIIDENHKTLPFITKYEKARILGERARQLNSGATPFVEVTKDCIDGYLIAIKEYEAKKIPFIIKRPLPSGKCEYWRFSDLELI